MGFIISPCFDASNHETHYLKPTVEKMLPLCKNIRQSVIMIQGGKDIFLNPKKAHLYHFCIRN